MSARQVDAASKLEGLRAGARGAVAHVVANNLQHTDVVGCVCVANAAAPAAKRSGSSRRCRLVALAVDMLLACVFVALMATPVTWGVEHEWLGMATFALVAAHVVLSRKRIVALVRARRAGAVATLVIDAALLACVLAQAASAVVLSKYALSWLPVVPGTAWARTAHLACSYWGFALAAVHAGLHLRVLTGKFARNRAGVWAGRIVFAVCLMLGAWSFADLGLWRYMTLTVKFAFIDPGAPLALYVAQFAAMGVAAAGIAHYARAVMRALAARK